MNEDLVLDAVLDHVKEEAESIGFEVLVISDKTAWRAIVSKDGEDLLEFSGEMKRI